MRDKMGKVIIVIVLGMTGLFSPYLFAEEISPFLDMAIVTRDLRDNLSLYLKNPGKSPIAIKDIFINGKDIKEITEKESLPLDERRKGAVRWYDILPNPIPPSGWGVLRVRFGDINEVGERVKVKLTTEDDLTLEGEVNVVYQPPIEFKSFSFDEKLKKLYLYISLKEGSSIKQVLIDGKDLTKLTTIRKIEDISGIHLLTISFDEQLRYGDYKVVKVVTNQGANACMIRVSPPYFPLALWEVHKYELDEKGESKVLPTPEEWLKDISGHKFNTIMQWALCQPSLDIVSRYNLRLITDHGWGNAEVFTKQYATHPDHVAWNVWDEPECTNAAPMEVMKFVNIIRESMSPRLIWNNFSVNQPAWYEYNFFDVISIDYYPVPLSSDPVPQESISVISDYLKELQEITHPNPIWFITQAFRDAGRRFPTPDEERLMVYKAVSSGAKGIIYFLYTFVQFPEETLYGVGQTDEPSAKTLWEAIRYINMELGPLGPLLAKGQVVPLAKVDRNQVEVSSIISGEDTIVLIVLNRDYDYYRMGSTSHPVKNVKVSLELPSWFKAVEVFRFDYQKGCRRIGYSLVRRGVEFSISELNVVEVVIVTTNPNLRLTIADTIRR